MFALKLNFFQKTIFILYSFSFFLNIFLREFEFLPYYKFEVFYLHILLYFGLVVLLISIFRHLNTAYIVNFFLKIRVSSLSEVFLVLTASVLVLAYALATPVFLGAIEYSANDLKELAFIDHHRSLPIYQRIPLNIIGYFSYTFVLFHIFYFLSFIHPTKYRFSRMFYLLGSLAGVFNELLVGGRTMFIYWLLSIVTMYMFVSWNFTDYINTKKIRIRLFFILIPLFFYFAIISIDRFANSYSGETDFDTVVSLIEYGGMGFYQFSNYLTSFDHRTHTFGRVFPILHDIINEEKFDLLKYRNSVNVDLSVFSTMFGDLYIDLGLFGVIGFLIFLLSIIFFTRKLKLFNLLRVFIFFYLFNICIQGIFYFSLWNKSSRIGFFVSLAIILIVRLIDNYGISHNRKLQ